MSFLFSFLHHFPVFLPFLFFVLFYPHVALLFLVFASFCQGRGVLWHFCVPPVSWQHCGSAEREI